MEREDYMRLALELAREAFEAGEVPVGCVIADETGAVIGRGCIISSGATIDRDVTIPDGTHIGCGRAVTNNTNQEGALGNG